MISENKLFLEIGQKDNLVHIPLLQLRPGLCCLKTKDAYCQLADTLEEWMDINKRLSEEKYQNLLKDKICSKMQEFDSERELRRTSLMSKSLNVEVESEKTIKKMDSPVTDEFENVNQVKRDSRFKNEGSEKEQNFENGELEEEAQIESPVPEFHNLCCEEKSYQVTATGLGNQRQFCTTHYTQVRDFGQAHSDSIEMLISTHNKKWLFTGGTDRTLKQWSLKTGGFIQNYDIVHKSSIFLSAITSDDKIIFTGDRLNFIKQWNIQKKVLMQDFGKIDDSFITAIAIASNNDYLQIGAETGLKEFAINKSADLSNQTKQTILINRDWGKIHDQAQITSILSTQTYQNLDDDNSSDIQDQVIEMVFTADHLGCLKQWCFSNQECIKVFKEIHKHEISHIFITPDLRQLLTIDKGQKACVNVFDLENDMKLYDKKDLFLKGSKDFVETLAIGMGKEGLGKFEVFVSDSYGRLKCWRLIDNGKVLKFSVSSEDFGEVKHDGGIHSMIVV